MPQGRTRIPTRRLAVIMAACVAALLMSSCSTLARQNAATQTTHSIQGKITEFPLPASDRSPYSIIMGHDGNLWFAVDHKIGRITPAGHLTEFPLPATSFSLFGGITAGPDGNLWFSETVTNSPQFDTPGISKIGRFALADHLTEFPLSTPNGLPGGITTGPDGNLWFTEVSLNPQSVKNKGMIGHMTPTGHYSNFPLPTLANIPRSLTTGPDGAIWFTESGPDGQNGKIGRLA